MKKAGIAVLAALLLVVLCEPHVRRQIAETVTGFGRTANETANETINETINETAGMHQASSPSFAEQLGGMDKADTLDVTLYYRFGDTSVLGAQRVTLDLRREETIATRIVERLVEGPDIAHDRLAGVFPQGTQVISVDGEDTTAFVTLSEHFLGRPDGAPADWEDIAFWQEEAALRRRLAVQSIVLSLTEDSRFQRVQLYIAKNDDDIPRRIAMAWFDPSVSDAALVLAASPRDEGAMLTPGRALEMILAAWQEKDYAALYQLTAPSSAEETPTLSVFEAEMKEMDVSLLTYAFSQGTVSYDGQTATLVLDAQIRSSEGGDAQIVRESVTLRRWQDNWAIELDTLRSLMIRD